MNRWEKEVLQSLLADEESVLKELKKQYKNALADINEKVKLFQSDIDVLDEALSSDGLDEGMKTALKSQRQSKIYQQQFQKALKSQVGGILDKMHGDNYSTISEYLNGCYEQGFVGTMYDMAKQGVPLIIPIDQAAAVKAVLTDSKVSKGLYNALGVNVGNLKKAITREISRGIASALPYRDIARNLSSVTKAPYSRTKTITRTEGHRIQQTSAADAQFAAKKKGADVVKQWDASLDARTRDSHAAIDGEIREIDDKFSNGLRFPGDPNGPAAEVINCRCTANTRARWALDEDELRTLKEHASFFGLDKTKNFKEFNEKYSAATFSVNKNDINYMSNAFRPKFSNNVTETNVVIKDKNELKTVTLKLKKVTNSSFEMYADTDVTRRNKAIRLTEKNLAEVLKTLPKDFSIPKVAVVDFEKNGLNRAAIGAYYTATDTVFFNSKYDTSQKISDFLKKKSGWFAGTSEYSPYRHELGHKYYEDTVKSLAKSKNMSYNKAKDKVDDIIQSYVGKSHRNGTNIEKVLGRNAAEKYEEHFYSEVTAECFSVSDDNDFARELLYLLKGVV